MKLISCHIENFGKLQNFDYSFDKDISIIHERNGWGKSTLATFIRVMFYGFIGENKRAVVDNERKRFKPWQSGVYGGNIVFSVDGMEYRVERRFGEKKSGTDEFALYDNKTNIISNDYSENVGEELFGIDIESFMRTVFIAQQDCGTEVTPNINAKIGNVSDQTADMGNYDAVQTKLKKEMDSLSPDRVTGLLSKLNMRMSELKERVRNKENYINSLSELGDGLEEQIDSKETKLQKQKEIQRKLEHISAVKDSQAGAEKYKEICGQESKARERHDSVRAFFPKDVPTKSDVDSYIKRCDEYEDYQQTVRSFSLSEDEKQKKVLYEKRFSTGFPDEESLSKVEEIVDKLHELESERNTGQLSNSERKKIEEAEQLFEYYKPSVEEIDNLFSMWGERKSKKEVLSTKKANAELFRNANAAASNSGGTSRIIGLILLVLGILSVVGGVIAIVATDSVPIGAAIAGLGVALLIVGILLTVRKSNNDNTVQGNTEYLRMLGEISDDEELIYSVEQSCMEMYEKLGIEYKEANVPSELSYIRGMIKDYDDLKDRAQRAESNESEENIRKTVEFITGFLSEYQLNDGSGDYKKDLFQLRSYITEYSQILKKVETVQEASRACEIVSNEIKRYLISLGFEPEEDLKGQLSQINEKCISLGVLSDDLEDKVRSKKAFEEQNDVTKYNLSEEPSESVSMEELNSSFNELNEQIDSINTLEDSYRSQMDDVAQKLETIEGDEAELAILKEDYEKAYKKYQIISKTRTYLEKAKYNFSSKYMGEIKSSFDKYRGIISDSDEQYELDANLNIQLRDKGSLHEVDYLSEGFKDLVGLCRRMAMVDAMYDLEKPFLVFDDPFVNLDENRLSGATRFLNDLSKEYQIIYFSCHQSRCD